METMRRNLHIKCASRYRNRESIILFCVIDEQNSVKVILKSGAYFARKKEAEKIIMDVAAAKLIGAGLAMIGTIGAGLGIGVLVNGAVQGIARNPDASGTVQTNMILGIAFAEAVAIYCLVVALLILFVG